MHLYRNLIRSNWIGFQTLACIYVKYVLDPDSKDMIFLTNFPTIQIKKFYGRVASIGTKIRMKIGAHCLGHFFS